MNLTAHFTAEELNYTAAPAAARRNLAALALLLEQVRAVLGVPLRVTSGYRAPSTNAQLPGASATSQHLDGTAADVVPVGLSIPDAMRRLSTSDARNATGQIIAYPYDGHLHVSLPTRGVVGAMLVQSSPNASAPVYRPYSGTLLASLEAKQTADSAHVATLAVATAAGLGILNS